MKEQNENYLGYKVLSIAFENDNLCKGISDACRFIEYYFNASKIIISKCVDEKYSPIVNYNYWLVDLSTLILNDYIHDIKFDRCTFLPLNDININNIIFIPFRINETKYVLSIVNSNDLNNVKKDVLMLQKVFKTIIRKYQLFDKLKNNSLIIAENELEDNEKQKIKRRK